MSTRDAFGDSRRSSGIILGIGLGSLLALTLLMDYLPKGRAKPAADRTALAAKLDACTAWKPGSSQSLSVFVKAFEDQPAVAENCFRARDRAKLLSALRERRKSRMASMGD